MGQVLYEPDSERRAQLYAAPTSLIQVGSMVQTPAAYLNLHRSPDSETCFDGVDNLIWPPGPLFPNKTGLHQEVAREPLSPEIHTVLAVSIV